MSEKSPSIAMRPLSSHSYTTASSSQAGASSAPTTFQPAPSPLSMPQPPAAMDLPPAYPDPSTELQSSPVMQPPPPAPKPALTPAQIGEQYRAELYAQCAQGQHDPTRKHGVCGIITAVLLFPLGIICLFLDTEKRCARCGVRIVKPKKQPKE